MNSRDVVKRLRNDVGVIDVPPIPQAVRQAVREQREKYIAYYGQAPEMKKSTRDMVVKGIFAAMVTAMVVSVPIIVVMTNRSPISDLPDTSVLPNSSGTVSAAESQIVTSTEQSETTLERIKLQQVYGEVALSGKSEEELETYRQGRAAEHSEEENAIMSALNHSYPFEQYAYSVLTKKQTGK